MKAHLLISDKVDVFVVGNNNAMVLSARGQRRDDHVPRTQPDKGTILLSDLQDGIIVQQYTVTIATQLRVRLYRCPTVVQLATVAYEDGGGLLAAYHMDNNSAPITL